MVRAHNVLLAAACAMLALGALEVGARLLPGRFTGREWRQGGNHPRGLVREDAELGYSLTPGFRGRDVNLFGDFDVPVEINSLGMRDHERDLTGCAATVIGLGDSYAYGEGVPLDRTYLSLLEAPLSRAAGRQVCVVKAGVPGYGLHQMSGAYRRLAERIPHDLALVGLLADDLQRIDRPFVARDGWLVLDSWAPLLQSCPNGDIHVRKSVLNPLHHALTCSSRAYSWLMGRHLPGEGSAPLGTWILPDAVPEQPSPRGGGDPEAHFRRLKSVSDRSGANLLVVALCFDDPALAELLARNQISYLSIPCERSWRFEHDWHFNERGHAAVAAIVADAVGTGLAPAGQASP